jgi:hypothetical protein
MKTKNFSTLVLAGFVLAAGMVTTACSSKKAEDKTAAADSSAMVATPVAKVAKNDVKLGKVSSGRAR